VTIEQNTTGVAEIRVTMTGRLWLADIEAQEAHRLSLRIRSDELGVLPLLGPGAAVECALDADEGRCCVAATVTDQSGEQLSLCLPPAWRGVERRTAARMSGGFAVSYVAGDGTGGGVCVDISAGGMRLRTDRAIPPWSAVDLEFILPGELLPLRIRGIVLYVHSVETGASAFDLGMKFLHQQREDEDRIARYCCDLPV